MMRSPHVALLILGLLAFGSLSRAEGDAHADSHQESHADHDASDFQHSASGSLGNLNFHIAPNVDVSILENIDAGFRYTFQVQPAFQSGIYTRVDRWTPHIDFHIPTVMTTIEPGAEVIFLRQFATKAEAIKATPTFDVHDIPLTATNALHMAPGEVVMLPVHLDLLFGPDDGVYYGPLQLFGRAQYVMRGLYQIQALRLADQRVRLRLVATRQHGEEAEVGARIRLEIFGVNILNKAFQAVFGKRLGSYQFDVGEKSLVMADYIFDLSSADARDAYNHLLSSDRLLTNAELVSPTTGADKIQKMFVADLDNVDQIASADRSLPLEKRRILQIFKGNSKQKDKQANLGISLMRVFAFHRMTDLAQDNKIQFFDSDNNFNEFLAPTQTVDKRLHMLFGLRSEYQTRKASLVASSDDHGVPKSMGDYVVSYEIKDSHLGVSESERILDKLRFNIAPAIIDQLNIAPLLEAKSYKNARVYAQVIFKESAFAAIGNLSRAQLIDRLSSHLETIDNHEHAAAVAGFATALEVALDPQKTPTERIKTFMSLQGKRYFRAVGTGCLMSLLPQDHLADFVSVYIRVDAASFKDKIERTFGTSAVRGVVRASEFIQNMLNNGTFDLRLETFGTVQAGSGAVISLKDLATPPSLSK